MSEDKTLLYIGVAIAFIAIAIVIYVVSKKGDTITYDEDGNPIPNLPPDFTGPSPGPSYSTLEFHKTVSYRSSITWNLNSVYKASILSGNYRVGGSLPTDIRIFVRSNGSWKFLKEYGGITNGGWPNKFAQFALSVNMNIDGIKWVAESGYIFSFYIDEVNAQLMVGV